ncbi:MAG TPA: MFS transporter [Ktedonosporobacter sp.]|jgi:MFS family permease|nr:MFS transporter [Ktedonosporobacter sp.]
MSLEVDKLNEQADVVLGTREEDAIAPIVAAKPTKSRAGVLINRNFALLWLGQAISIIGDYVFDTTLVLWIFASLSLNQSWAPLAVSGLFLMTNLPNFLVGPLAGVFVDRWQKRQTMMNMDVIRACLVAVLLIAALLGHITISWQLGIIYGVVLLASVCSQFFNPARLVLIGDIVPESEQARATGMLQMTVSLAVIFGPVLAAMLYNVVGVYLALFVNALSFVGSFLAILAIRVPAEKERREQAQGMASTSHENDNHANNQTKKSFWLEFREGLQFCLSNRVLLTMIVTLVVSLFGVGSVNALTIFFVQQNLHVPASYYGILATAFGIGTAIGAIVAGMGAQRLGLVRTLWLSLLAMSAIFFLYSRLNNFSAALVVIFLLGFPIAAFNVALMPLVLRVVPRELVGRVAAVVNPLQSLALMLSIFIAGTLESTVLAHFHLVVLGIVLGPIDTIYTAVSGIVLIAGVYAMISLAKARIAPAA